MQRRWVRGRGHRRDGRVRRPRGDDRSREPRIRRGDRFDAPGAASRSTCSVCGIAFLRPLDPALGAEEEKHEENIPERIWTAALHAPVAIVDAQGRRVGTLTRMVPSDSADLNALCLAERIRETEKDLDAMRRTLEVLTETRPHWTEGLGKEFV